MNALTKGIKFIVASDPEMRIRCHQSTIPCLKALTQYSQFARRTNRPEPLISVNGKVVARKYEAGEREAIVIDSLKDFSKMEPVR